MGWSLLSGLDKGLLLKREHSLGAIQDSLLSPSLMEIAERRRHPAS